MTRVTVWHGSGEHARKIAKLLRQSSIDARVEVRHVITVPVEVASNVRELLDNEYEHGAGSIGGAE